MDDSNPVTKLSQPLLSVQAGAEAATVLDIKTAAASSSKKTKDVKHAKPAPGCWDAYGFSGFVFFLAVLLLLWEYEKWPGYSYVQSQPTPADPGPVV